jgi:hypothetical protein
MRAPHPSKGSRNVWWHHFRWKGPNMVDIAELPVAHIPPFQGNPEEVTWCLMTSHPVAMSVMRSGTFCTTTIVRKKRGNRLRMRTRSLPVMCLPVPVTWLLMTSFPVTSLPVAPHQIRLLSVLIYYLHPGSQLWNYDAQAFLILRRYKKNYINNSTYINRTIYSFIFISVLYGLC